MNTPVSPVHHGTRALCAAWRSAVEWHGGAGASRGTRGWRGGWFRPSALLSLLLMAAACHQVGDRARNSTSQVDEVAETRDPTAGFAHAAASLEDLGRGVMASLVRSDSSALERYRLNETEHNEMVWPELPAAAPEANFPLDYAWENIERRNRRGLARIVPLFANRTVGFNSVECRGPTERFETFRVRTDCYVVFAAGDGPALWEVQLFKDVVERDGGFKIFRYYAEGPRPWRGAVPE